MERHEIPNMVVRSHTLSAPVEVTRCTDLQEMQYKIQYVNERLLALLYVAVDLLTYKNMC